MDMNIIMNDSHIVSMWQVEERVKTAVVPTFSFDSHQQAHAWVSEVLDRFRYFDKQRTIKEKKETGTLKYGKGKKKHQFKKIYTPEDARLLVLADNAYRRMSEDAMRAVFRDEYALYGKNEYERLSKISHGHFYRLRATDAYKENALTIGRTISVSRAIGIRKKPQPDGKPGYIRADTVHQGDLDREKGVYHINLVDEVTQWEILVCVDSITEESM